MTKHILIADDEASFRFAASLSLRQGGYEVSLAENGTEAFQKITEQQAQGHPFDLLVLDIQMPGMTGIDVFENIHKKGITTPVVFVTGYDDERALSRLDEKYNSSVLHKPFESEQMLNMVELMMKL
jgi:two-component system alkaline phosphatase synthesis response regulator PhoP